ncbi:hypothetical protein [uncultured Akkermansia sp.]|uniref:hypothetical protein n=1 Tax=uncultured Akkermansia sp. TaxID=512294 RepID=UPI00260E46A8|nr:hypothetical protein [uncultured Akkermansia sp.]
MEKYSNFYQWYKKIKFKMKIIKIYLVLLIFGNGILRAEEKSDISPLQAAIETVINVNKELNTKISIINESTSTYIPFEFEDKELPFAPFDYITGQWPYLNAVLPEKYEALYLSVDVNIKKFKIIFLNNCKIYFHEIYINESGMLYQCSFIVGISCEINKKLVGIVRKYKNLNNSKKRLSMDDVRIVNYISKLYGGGQTNEFIAYGYNSKIFGIIFGGLLLPPKHTPALDIYSLFNSMMAYFENLKNNDIPRCDSLFINGLNSNIEKIILNSSLFGTAKTLDGCPGSR